jgi:NADH-quinone oxidoreductase subunit G
MCDPGRMEYRWMNRGDRVEAPLVRQDGRLHAGDWDAALARLADLVRSTTGPVVLLASGRASNESLGWVRRLLEGRDVTAAVRIPLGEEAPLAGVPNLALRPERAPNGDGARLAGYGTDWNAAVAQASAASLTLVLDAELTDAEAARVSACRTVVGLLTVDDERFAGAELVLPVTTVAEENGTWINRDGRVQRYMQAKSAPGMARPAWWVAATAWEELGRGAAPETAEQAFSRLGETIVPLGGLRYADLGLTGRVLDGIGAGA